MDYSQTAKTDISQMIIALETKALEMWNHGDPNGYLDLSAEDVTYFDPSIEQRLDGLDNLKKYYEPIKGQVKVSKYKMINPKVIATKEMAVLTFNLHSYIAETVSNWNCTEVYRLSDTGEWKIIQTHWSNLIKPL